MTVERKLRPECLTCYRVVPLDANGRPQFCEVCVNECGPLDDGRGDAARGEDESARDA